MLKRLIHIFRRLIRNYRATTIVKLPAGSAENQIVRTRDYDYVAYTNNG